MVRRILIILISFSAFICLSTNIHAQEATLPDEYENVEEGIPDDILDLLPDGLFSNDLQSIIDALEDITSWEFISGFVFDVLGIKLKDALRALSVILGVLLIGALINMIKRSIMNTSLASALDMLTSIILVAALYRMASPMIEQSVRLLKQIVLFVNSTSPVIVAMYAMGGNITSAAVQNFGLVVFLSILENLCIIALETTLSICMALTLSSAFLGSNNLLPISIAIRRCFTMFIGLATLVFTTVISAQTILTSKADSLSAKTAKMLALEIIPLVGGTVGESLRTAGASIEYLRSNIGVAFIIILALMIIPTLISVAMYRLVFSVSGSIASILACGNEEKLLGEISGIFGYALAVLSICSIVLIFLITIFAKSASPLA